MSRKRFLSLMLYICTFLPSFIPLHAQEKQGEIIIISERVGKEIDQEEAEKFKFFKNSTGFHKAICYKSTDNKYLWKISYIDEKTNELTVKYRHDSESSINKYRNYIDRFEEIQAEKHQGIKDNYVQIAETLHVPDSGYVQILKSNDGSTLYGRITAIYNEEIEFTTDSDTLKIKITTIKSIEDVPQSSFRNGKYWFPNPNNTRLYLGPKGRMLEKGTGYVQCMYLDYAEFAIGITDNITLGGGASMIPGAFYFRPKVGIKATETFDLAVGALIAYGQMGLGILYSVGTFGKENSNFTAGFAYGFVVDDLLERPMIILGYEGRTSRRTAFVTENWIFPGEDVSLISYGIRFFGKKFAVDLAFINFPGEDIIFPGIPYVDFVYNF